MKKAMCVAAILLSVATLNAAELSLNATKDARIFGHSSETALNGGSSARLRTVGIGKSSYELTILDFDRAAIKAFVDGNAGKTLSGKLVLNVRELQGFEDPVKLEVASIDAASDWVEGTGSQVQAKKGECCAVAARFEEQKWTLPNGTEVANLRDLVWDGKAVKGVGNGKSLAIAKDDGGKQVELELDAALIRHMATSANCKGIFLFHQDAKAKVDFFSKEQVKKGSVLILKAE